MEIPNLRTNNVVKAGFAVLFTAVVLATQAGAAVISWQMPVNVDLTQPSQVLNNGDYVSAGALYPEYLGGGNIVVNNVSFGPIDNSHYTETSNGGGFQFSTQTGGDTNYINVTGGILYFASTGASPAALTATTFTGLVQNTTYQLQLWVGFFPSNLSTRFSSSQPTGDPSALTAPDQSAALNVGNNPNTGPVSQFVVGTFTADGTTQSLYIFPSAGTTGLLSAYSLRAVPEPQTWALAALGISAVCFRLRRKQRSV